MDQPPGRRSFGKTASELRRAFGLKLADSIHLATALLCDVPVLNTYDETLLKLDSRCGSPRRLAIRVPSHPESRPLFDKGESPEIWGLSHSGFRVVDSLCASSVGSAWS